MFCSFKQKGQSCSVLFYGVLPFSWKPEKKYKIDLFLWNSKRKSKLFEKELYCTIYSTLLSELYCFLKRKKNKTVLFIENSERRLEQFCLFWNQIKRTDLFSSFKQKGPNCSVLWSFFWKLETKEQNSSVFLKEGQDFLKKEQNSYVRFKFIKERKIRTVPFFEKKEQNCSLLKYRRCHSPEKKRQSCFLMLSKIPFSWKSKKRTELKKELLCLFESRKKRQNDFFF